VRAAAGVDFGRVGAGGGAAGAVVFEAAERTRLVEGVVFANGVVVCRRAAFGPKSCRLFCFSRKI
jgi:hypothetical protein